MTTLTEEILKLADVEQMLKDTGAESTHGQCHNACTWLILQIKKAGLPEYRVALCTGTFWGRDHSWLLIEDEEQEVIIDMTVNQFVDRPVPWSGLQTDEYAVHKSMNIASQTQELADFILSLGGGVI